VLTSDWATFQAHMKKVDLEESRKGTSAANWIVVPLIIDSDKSSPEVSEAQAANSAALWKYYAKLELTTLQCPINILTTPHRRLLTDCIERIAVYLAKGKNVVVSCHGGSGRTGTMLMSIAKTLGVPNVIGWGRRAGGPGKASWVETHEQELFIDQLPRIMTQYMKDEMRANSVFEGRDEFILQKLDQRFAQQHLQWPVWNRIALEKSGKFNVLFEKSAQSNIEVAECRRSPTNLNGEDFDGRTIVMMDKCQFYRPCRTCFQGNAGDMTILPLTDAGKASYDYLDSDVTEFPVVCTPRAVPCA